MSNSISSTKASSISYPVLVISLCACFLFYKYVLQIYPSVITEQLMGEFHLTGAGLGNLAATFYYSYTVTQLIVGVILDRYSARWLTSLAILSCALGVLVFSQTLSLITAEFARALMGVGVAFATVAYMKLAAAWFPPKQYAFVSGLLATAAMAGAVFGQAPLALVVHNIGWRDCLYLLAIFGFVLAAVFVVIVRDAPKTERRLVVNQAPAIPFSLIWQVFKNKQNWLLTLYSGLAFSPVVIFGGLWGNPFVQAAYHVNQTQAATLVSLIFIGLGFGSPLLGMFSDKLGERRKVMFYATLIACFAISLVLYGHPMSIWLVGALLFIFGFALGAFMLAFTMGKELNSIAVTATVIAMINSSDAILDSITEPGIGKLLDLTWDGTLINGVHVFSLHSYHLALSVLPLYLAVAALLLLWVKAE